MTRPEILCADIHLPPSLCSAIKCFYDFSSRMGYDGLMKKRTDDYCNEGEAIFYKTSRFTRVEFNTYSMADLAFKVRHIELVQ